MGMRFEVPPDWEIVRHGQSTERGSLVLFDHREQRLEVHWEQAPRTVDVMATMDALREKSAKRQPEMKFESVSTYNGWYGFRQAGLSRVARFDPERMLENRLVLMWPQGVDHAVERRVIESFALIDPPPPTKIKEGELIKYRPTRWRAFGLQITAPAGWALTEVEARPANITFNFHHAVYRNQTAAIHRRGMFSQWFSSVQRYLRSRVGYGPEIRIVERVVDGRTILRGQSMARTSGFKKMTRGQRQRLDLAWLNEAADAGLCVSVWDNGQEEIEPEQFEVEAYPLP